MSTDSTDAPGAPAPTGGRGPFGLARWVGTNNPFYVVSAALFLGGLRASFEARDGDWQVGALMLGLAGYTTLLAVTGWGLVRFWHVWDDARTVLLLVVLMFLATSVTFDDVLVADPLLGTLCAVGGFGFAAAVSEGVLRSVRVRLPAGFRVPYYLALGLFFGYPLAVRPFIDDTHGEALMWMLFGFSTAAGVVALSLIPAARRGPGYVRGNGSPWPWPFYPWSLFVILGLAVPVRANLLCVSFHLLKFAEYDGFIFAPYFLVPFGLAVGLVLLEIGVATPRRGAMLAALAVPPVLVVLASVGHSAEPVYNEFLDHFRRRLGGTPLFLTVLIAAGFYAYTTVRRVPFAVEGLTGALALFAVVGPADLRPDLSSSPNPAPILVAAGAQLVLGLLRHDGWRCLIAAGGLVLAAGAVVPAWADGYPVRLLVTYHLGIACVLAVGAAFRRDEFGQVLQFLGTAVAFVGCVAALVAFVCLPVGPVSWTIGAYPLAVAAVLAGYGWLTRYPPSVAVAGLIAVGCGAAVGVRGYIILRRMVAGLDAIVLSFTAFAVAVGVSWLKSRTRRRPVTRDMID